MTRKLIKLGLFVFTLSVLQQVIALGNRHVSQLQAQAHVVKAHDLDPSALFYMEVDLALAAEKAVRARIAQ